MKNKTYLLIIWICLLLCIPMGLIQMIRFNAYKKETTDPLRLKLESSLKTGLVIILLEITIICFLFYQFGRNLIHVMGTFY